MFDVRCSMMITDHHLICVFIEIGDDYAMNRNKVYQSQNTKWQRKHTKSIVNK